MPVWRLRDFHDDDLDQAIQIWDQSRAPGSVEPVFAVAEVMAAARARQPAVVAEVGDELVGMAVAQTQGDRAWVILVALAARWRQRGSAVRCWRTWNVAAPPACSASARWSARARLGRRRSRTPATPGATGSSTTKCSSTCRRQANLLAELGGSLVPDTAHRVVAGDGRNGAREGSHRAPGDRAAGRPGGRRPARRRAPARRDPVRPARYRQDDVREGDRARLGWPFVEVFPSRLAARTGRAGGALRELFECSPSTRSWSSSTRSRRSRRRAARSGRDARHRNELLKLIPAFREPDSRLLVCATNSVRELDPAFTRPGRFDYVIPVGPPDRPARAGIWQRYLADVTDAEVDVDELAEPSDYYSAADIEFAARKAAQPRSSAR